MEELVLPILDEMQADESSDESELVSCIKDQWVRLLDEQFSGTCLRCNAVVLVVVLCTFVSEDRLSIVYSELKEAALAYCTSFPTLSREKVKSFGYHSNCCHKAAALKAFERNDQCKNQMLFFTINACVKGCKC